MDYGLILRVGEGEGSVVGISAGCPLFFLSALVFDEMHVIATLYGCVAHNDASIEHQLANLLSVTLGRRVARSRVFWVVSLLPWKGSRIVPGTGVGCGCRLIRREGESRLLRLSQLVANMAACEKAQ